MFFLIVYLWAQSDWDINLDALSMIPEETSPLQDKLLSGRFRFSMTGKIGNHTFWGVAYEQTAIYQKNSIIGFPQNNQLRIDDWKHQLDSGRDGIWSHQIDRLYIQRDHGSVRIVAGRQAAGHGNGRFFNPSDIFMPLSPYHLNTEYKRGIDGLRMSWSLPEDWEVEAMYFFNEPGKNMALLRTGGHLGNMDLSVYIGSSYGEDTCGWDLAWTMGDSAFYTEGLTRRGENRDRPWRLMGGFQRQLTPEINLIVEHLYDSSGFSDFSFSGLPPIPAEFLLGEQFFLGNNHTAVAMDLELSPLWHAGLQAIHDFAGSSDWIVLSLDWDVRSYSSIRSGLLLPSGPENSDFGSFSSTLFIECKWYL
jgi:hypothetical protein